jgi:hypothetical protein
VILTDEERRALERLVCAQKTGQALVRRARVVLLAAAGYSNVEIARLVPMDEEAVGLWRRRWVAGRLLPLSEVSVAERLADAPRPGHQPRLRPEQFHQDLVRRPHSIAWEPGCARERTMATAIVGVGQLGSALARNLVPGG